MITSTTPRPIPPTKDRTTPAAILDAALAYAEAERACVEAGYAPIRGYVKEAGE